MAYAVDGEKLDDRSIMKVPRELKQKRFFPQRKILKVPSLS